MKKISIILCLIFAIGIFSQSCEKEKIVQNNVNPEISDLKAAKKPSIAQLAAMLGVSVDAILDVDYISGNLAVMDVEYYPNGTIKHQHIECNWAPWSLCYTHVKVKANVKGENNGSNGYISIKFDTKNKPAKVFLVFYMESLSNAHWLSQDTFIATNDFPLTYADQIGLCKEGTHVMVPKGKYPLNSAGLYKYIEINTTDLIIEEGELIIK